MIKKIVRKAFKVILTLICNVRSLYYTTKIDGGGGKIIIKEAFIKFSLLKHPSSELIVKGNLAVSHQLGGGNPIKIRLAQYSKLSINGDFEIGNNVRILLEPNSSLIIGGKENESGSGITGDTLIMVHTKIEIGKDFLCAWDVFITDSDWHQIKGQVHHANVTIGDHVWIANNTNVLKGSSIGNNCIVASNSKIINKVYPENVLIAGIPSKIIKENIEWCRDVDKD